MRSDKREAFKLRRSGKSYKQIVEMLRISKSTLSDWFSDIDWSNRLKRRLIEKNITKSTERIVALDAVRGKHLKRAYAEARREAQEEFETLKYKPLFIAGLMLYWGEGDQRTPSQVRLTNTNPKMLRLFVTFLRHVCRIPNDRIRGNVIIYPDLDAGICTKYWARQTDIPEKYFSKCSIIRGRHPSRRLSYGICIVVVSSSYFKVKILRWLELMPQELMSKRYYASM